MEKSKTIIKKPITLNKTYKSNRGKEIQENRTVNFGKYNYSYTFCGPLFIYFPMNVYNFNTV